MDNNIKRRTFIGAAVGTLLAAPFAFRYFWSGEKKSLTSYRFNKELQKYQSLVDVPVRPITEISSANVNFRPQPQTGWNYVMFLPAFLPEKISQATAGEPDYFIAREGSIYFGNTKSGQTVLFGEQTVSKTCAPLGQDVQAEIEFVYLVSDGKLQLAREKGVTQKVHRDRQLENLLTLQNPPNKPLTVGTRWTSNTGRLLPFTGFKTEYEVVGFAEIAGLKTVNIRFSASVPNVLTTKGQTMTNKHSGNAYFDVDSGLLVRQETDITPHCTGLSEELKDLTANGKLVLQLFQA